MAAQCEAKVVIALTGLGQEIELSKRFANSTAPDAAQYGYGTIAGAATMEAIPMGQVSGGYVDLVYVRSVDNTIYVSPTTVVSTGALLKLEAGEFCVFRPTSSLGTTAVLSVGVTCSTAEAKYEYMIVGQSS